MIRKAATVLTGRIRPFFAAVLATAVLVGGCTDGTLPTAGGGTARIVFGAGAGGLAEQVDMPINRIRVTALRQPGDAVLIRSVFEVDPNATAWPLALDLPLEGEATVLLLFELANVDGAFETVVYSGRVGPLRLAPGATVNPPAPQLLPGPADNLSVTGLTVPQLAPVLEGATFSVPVTIQGGGPGARVLFTALDPTIASISNTGQVRALLPGVARFQVSAGPVSQTISVAVLPRATTLVLQPAVQTLASFGAVATFAAQLRDTRGGTLQGDIEWLIDNARVAAPLGGGRFQALSDGSATITAVGPGGLVATAVLTVAQQVAQVQVTPPSSSVDLAHTLQLSATARDANGNIMPGAAITWSSSDPTVATVSGTGLVTARAPGAVTITAASGSASGTAAVTVVQPVKRVTVTPAASQLVRPDETVQLTAVARDTFDNVIAGRTVTWTTSDASIATVSAAGLVTSVGPGTATITATIEGVAGQATVRVQGAPAVFEGAVLDDANGNALTGAVELYQAGRLVGSVGTAANGTFRFDEVPPGTYEVVVYAAGYLVGGGTVTLGQGQTVTQVYRLMREPGSATLIGRVVSASSGQGVAGATVQVATRSTTSNSNGDFVLQNIPEGTQTVSISANGFAAYTENLQFPRGATIERNFVVVPQVPEGYITIVLTWGADPRDLDSHLDVPGGGHIAYYSQGNLNQYPFAELDVDDTNGFGPETITISQQQTGDYVYRVHHWSGSLDLSRSGGRVDVYRGGTRVATFHPPANATGRWWHVFKMNGAQIAPLDVINDDPNWNPGGGGLLRDGGSLRAVPLVLPPKSSGPPGGR